MSKNFILHTHNTPVEEIYNLITQRTENSRIVNVKRDGDTLKGRREIFYPSLTSMGQKISSEFPDKIYMDFVVKKVKEGLYMKYILPEQYSAYVRGCEKVLIKDNGEINISLEYKIIKSVPSSFMDFKSTVYNKTVESLESYILSIYESKRRISFDKPCEVKVGSFEEILSKY